MKAMIMREVMKAAITHGLENDPELKAKVHGVKDQIEAIEGINDMHGHIALMLLNLNHDPRESGVDVQVREVSIEDLEEMRPTKH